MNLGKVCLLAALVCLPVQLAVAADCPLQPPIPNYAALTAGEIEPCTTKIGEAISAMEDIVRAANGRAAFNKDEAEKLHGKAWIPVKEGGLIDRFAYRLHREYKRLKLASKKLGDDDKRKLLLRYTSESVHRLMAARGLREPLAAVLDTGFVLGDSGNSAIPYARTTTDKTAYGVVDWESKHYRDDEDGLYDFSFGGRFGLMPALALVKRGDNKPGIRTLYQQAFQWNFSGRVNIDFGNGGGELSLLGRFGQAQLMSETEAIGTQEPRWQPNWRKTE